MLINGWMYFHAHLFIKSKVYPSNWKGGFIYIFAVSWQKLIIPEEDEGTITLLRLYQVRENFLGSSPIVGKSYINLKNVQ